MTDNILDVRRQEQLGSIGTYMDVPVLTTAPVSRTHYGATITGCTDDALHKKYMLEWYGLAPVRNSWNWKRWAYCPHRLINGKPCAEGRDDGRCEIVGESYPNGIWDHARAWRNGDGDLVYTVEPWGNPVLAAEEILDLSQRLEKHGIVMSFEGRSPYGSSYVLFMTSVNNRMGTQMYIYNRAR